MLVQEVMAKPRTVLGVELATRARAIFNSEGVRTLYVVDQKNRLEGVLDREDIINLKSRSSDLTAKGISNQVPVSLAPATMILDAARMLVDAGVVDAPVVDTEGSLVGQVDANLLLGGFLQKKYAPKAGLVSDVMTKKAIAARHDEPMETVLPKLEKHRSLPVLKNGKLVGILTRADILKNSRFSRQKSANIERVMKTPPVTVNADEDTGRAASLLVKHDFNALPVVDSGGSLKGIITRYDLLRAYSKG